VDNDIGKGKKWDGGGRVTRLGMMSAGGEATINDSTSRGTAISQSVIDIVSDVKQKNVKTCFGTLDIICTELRRRYFNLLLPGMMRFIMHLCMLRDDIIRQIQV
jgi:hypothetical protein